MVAVRGKMANDKDSLITELKKEKDQLKKRVKELERMVKSLSEVRAKL